ncbi:hypothetical protein [Streptosporangium subroseum]|uniref:hypothetical protein n=1 Tax=Streptosporangium subroseum TaxID=106412 RepID=UPI0030917042|nr:hypothetical protein OHB15_19470 [Streptosporangium subroseum]
MHPATVQMPAVSAHHGQQLANPVAMVPARDRNKHESAGIRQHPLNYVVAVTAGPVAATADDPRAGAASSSRESDLGIPRNRRGTGRHAGASTVWRILHDAGVDPVPRRSGPSREEFLGARTSGILACGFFHANPLRALPDTVDADIKVIRRGGLDDLLHEYSEVA